MSTRRKVVDFLNRMSKHPKQRQNKLTEANKNRKWNIVRGDQVQVINRKHPEYGKQGIVLKVDRKNDRVFVENVNMKGRNVKANPEQGLKGKTVVEEQSIHYSNVNLVDPVTGQPTRIFKKYLEDGTKVRVAKKSGAIIPRPEILSQRRNIKPVNVTESDTASDDDVWEVTYNNPNPNAVMKQQG